MGIAFSFLPFFDCCHRRRALHNPFLALGSLELHETEKEMVAFGQQHSYGNFLRQKDLRSLFLDRYDIRDYQDCDINGKADLYLDLNLPLGQDLSGRMGTVLDGGTLEHLLDIKQALSNIHFLVRPGGTIIHISPLTWFDHAFFNFNPKLFKNLIHANGYQLLVEAYWFPSEKRKYWGGKNPPHLVITFDGEEQREASRLMTHRLHQPTIPARVLYMIAYQKKQDNPFQVPYDR